MTALALQTVLTLVVDRTTVGRAAFPWGTPRAPFSLGTKADWIVSAPGVADVHLFLAFDGRQLQVAGGPAGAAGWLNGSPIGPNWQTVPVPSELRLGEACIQVNCEPLAPESATQVSPDGQPGALRAKVRLETLPLTGPGQAAGGPEPAPPAPAAESSKKARAFAGTALLDAQDPSVAIRAARVIAPTKQVAVTGRAAQPSASPPPTAPPQGSAGARPSAPPQGSGDYQASAAPQGSAGYQASAAPQAPSGHQPSAAPQASSGSPSPVAAAIGSGPLQPVASPAQVLPQNRGLGFATASDAGALKDHALRLFSAPPPNPASPSPEIPRQPAGAEPTLEAPRYGQAQGYGAASPTAPTAPQRMVVPEAIPNRPMPRPGPSGKLLPERHHARSDHPAPTGSTGAGSDKKRSGWREAWNKTSWPMRVALCLLPVAAYFGLIWEPDSPPKRGPALVRARASISAETNRAPSPRQVTSPVAQNSAAGSLATAELAPPVAALASTPEASAPALVGIAAAASSSPAEPRAGVSPASSSQARSEDTPDQRLALNAAFEGKLQEAATRYAQLAGGPNGHVFALAARFSREQAVRKP